MERYEYGGFINCNSSDYFSSYSRSDHKFWRKPPDGWMKCNVDESFLDTTTQSRAGWVLRGDTGKYLGTAQSTGRRIQSAIESELQAILIALQYCWSRGYKKIIVK